MAQFTYEVELSGTEESPWVTLEQHQQYGSEGSVNGASSTLILTFSPDTVGSGYIQTTTESIDKVYTDSSNLHPLTWTPGTVSNQTQVSMPAPTAFKVICTSGDIHVSARGI